MQARLEQFLMLLVTSCFSVEYTDMAHHARKVMTANGVDNVVTVLQGAVEDIVLPIEEDGLNPDGPIDIMIR